MVLGDSHARSYYAGLGNSFPDVEFIFYEFSGCRFYSVEFTEKYPKKNLDDKCRQTRKEAFSELRGKPDTLILSQNWGGGSGEALVSELDGREVHFTDTQGYASFVSNEIIRLKREF